MSFYSFDIQDTHKSIIKVIGVGGGGSNAVNYMYKQGIKDVEFMVCNTDSQHLAGLPIPNKIQIGVNVTKGLGAGAYPEKGKESALENKEQIREVLSNGTKMLFITAGMGGGTGTGAAPIVAEIARELDILTIGIVTLPFRWEGPGKKRQAVKGIEEMKANCDTVIIINNDKLGELFGKLEIAESFAKANDVLLTAAKSIAEVITVKSEMNVDFADVERVMKNSGAAVMGSAIMRGEDRSKNAIESALYSPLIDSCNVFGAQNILLCINYGPEAKFTMDELSDITDFISEKVGEEADVIPGLGMDENLGDSIRVTIIATGFEGNTPNPLEQKKVLDLQTNAQINMFEKPVEKSTPRVEDRIEPKAEVKEEPKEDRPQFMFDFNSSRKQVISLDDDINTTDTTRFENKQVEEKQTPKEEVKPTIIEKNTEIKPILNDEENQEKMKVSLSQRIERLRNLSSIQNMEPEELKEKLEVPSYIRKKQELKDHPHSSEKNISRFSLDENNEILGNNRFLHDNVD